jgi:NAD(P)-dependent dehydrogenase (short-subunit alcohol dehydrogenase family)
MAKLDGKVAIVTGAARGLGRAYAKRLAGLGASVAVTDINLRSYEEFEADRGTGHVRRQHGSTRSRRWGWSRIRQDPDLTEPSSRNIGPPISVESPTLPGPDASRSMIAIRHSWTV